METVINFLKNKDYDWSIKSNGHRNYNEVLSNLGFNTVNEAQEYLINKIKEKLFGNEITQLQFEKIKDHFHFNYLLGNLQYKSPYIFICKIQYIINRLESYTNSLYSWLEVKNYLEAYIEISNNFDNYEPMPNEKNLISESIIFLRKKGCKISITNGDILIDEISEKIFFQKIQQKFNKLGDNSIKFLLEIISNNYDYKSKRYFLKNEPSITNNYLRDTPYGYLFNISIGNFKKQINKTNKKTNKKNFLDAVELVTHYFCIKQIQSFNKFCDVNCNKDTILLTLIKNILNDQYFSIDQVSIDHIKEIMQGVFNSPEVTFNEINIYIDILELVSKTPNYTAPLYFNESYITSKLNNKYKLEEIKLALNNLSFTENKINNKYYLPNQIEHRNYYQKPFIFNGYIYTYINPIICNYGFYSSAIRLYENEGIDGGHIGEMIENFFSKKLTSTGINFLSNKTYKIKKEISKELSINSEQSECDFIIETKKTIIFIELKRKGLTSEARKGNILQATIDMAQSFLHALAQTGRHEYVLRKQGEIEFTDGSKILLNNKNVERVALSFSDFYGIHDIIFIHEFLKNLVNSKIDSGDKNSDEKINKYLTEITNQFQTEIFSNAYHNRNKFFNCRFFSITQMLEILSNCSDNEEFEHELNRTKYVTTRCKDWFFDYNYQIKISSK